jgi:hypothetical protein
MHELSNLDASWYVPGHGCIGTHDDVTRLIEYVEYCLESVSKLIKTRSCREALTEIRIPDKFMNWKMPKMFQSNLHAIYERIRRC